MLLLFLDATQGSAQVPGGPAVFPQVASDEGTPHICVEVRVWDTRGQEPSRPECPDQLIKVPRRLVSSCKKSSGPQSSVALFLRYKYPGAECWGQSTSDNHTTMYNKVSANMPTTCLEWDTAK